MRKVRNMRELKLVKQKLKIKQMLYEKDLSGSSWAIMDNLSDRLRDLAFDFGSRLVSQLISGFRKRRS